MEHGKRVRRKHDDEAVELPGHGDRSGRDNGPPTSISDFAAAPAAAQRVMLSTVQRLAGNAAAGAALQRAPVPVVQGLWGATQITAAKKAAKKALNDTDPTLRQYGHIRERHGSLSKAAGAGKFSDDKKIIPWVRLALSSGTPYEGVKAGSYEFELDIDGVGTNINGGKATRIRVILASGPSPFVITAYPY